MRSSHISQKFHFTFNANKAELFCGSISIIKEEFISRLDIPLGKNPNAVITIYFEDLSVAIRIDRMVGETDFVPFSGGVDHKLVVQVEKERAHVFVINLSSAVSFFLADDFPTILGNEFVFGRKVSDENAPSGHV